MSFFIINSSRKHVNVFKTRVAIYNTFMYKLPTLPGQLRDMLCESLFDFPSSNVCINVCVIETKFPITLKNPGYRTKRVDG